jgi:hypothetical protein
LEVFFISVLNTPPLNEDQRKSLELLQGIINRLSTNGFLLKGWAVTIVSALLTFSGSSGQARLAALALLPTVIFWALDAYLLARERQCRALFERTRLGTAAAFDFQLPALGALKWLRCGLGSTLGLYYLPLAVLALVLVRSGR